MRDENLFQNSVSRGIPRSLLKREMILDTLSETQQFPRYPSPHKRNTEVHATTQEEPRVHPSQLEMRVDSVLHQEKNPDVSITPSEEADLT